MTALDRNNRHEEVWLLLPWLANGRLSDEERGIAEEHVRQCAACERELALQHRMCSAFMQPDRVVYAPAPSFRKLIDRIDSDNLDTRRSNAVAAISDQQSMRRMSRVSLWRPPGIAWAASFLLLFGMSALMLTAYWSAPRYTVRSDHAIIDPIVLHIALDRSLPIGEVDAVLLHAGGARIVEGPNSTGVLGVTPVGVDSKTPATTANKLLRLLSARLRADPRVLWVQPLADEGTPTSSDAQEH